MQSPLVASFPAGGFIPTRSDYWSRAVATTDIARLSTTARTMDPAVAIAMTAGTYMIRGVYFFTAEAGGPALVHRLNGPTATLINIDRGIAAGVQNAGTLAPGQTCRLAYDAADVNTTWNTGGPAQAFGLITITGYVTASASGTFGVEWTSDSATWALTRRKGSYLEYHKL